MANTTIHLRWNTGELLCDEPAPQQVWLQANWTQSLPNWQDLLCQHCFSTWQNPTRRVRQRKEVKP